MSRRLFLLWTLPLLIHAQGPLSSEKIAAIEKVVSAAMSANSIPGASVAVAAGRDIWTNGYGLADLENFVPAKAATVYRTASIAKPMTAVAIMQLAEQGKIDLDAPVQKYLPSFPTKQWPITTRQLLGHIAGVRHYKQPTESYLTEHFWTLTDAIRVFESDELMFEPGTKYGYTTFGYVLLGRIVEAVSGQDYMTYLGTHVLDPAGMKNTGMDDVYALIPNRSHGYQKNDKGSVVNAALADTSHKVPGGGLLSSAADLVRFAVAFRDGKLVQPRTRDEMLTPLKLRDGRTTGYGLGWGIGEFRGRRLISHAGGQAGVSTMLAFLPDHDLTVALMFNMEGVRVGPVLESVLAAVLQ